MRCAPASLLIFLPGCLVALPHCQLIASGIGQKIESSATLITSVTSASIQHCTESCCEQPDCNSLSFSMDEPEGNCALHHCDNGSLNLSCAQVFDGRFNSGFVAVPSSTPSTPLGSTDFFLPDGNATDLAWWQRQPQQNDSTGQDKSTADGNAVDHRSDAEMLISLTTFVLIVSLLGALLLVSLSLNAAQLHFYRQLSRRQQVYQTASMDRLQTGKFTTAF